jgi:hypothetical protein
MSVAYRLGQAQVSVDKLSVLADQCLEHEPLSVIHQKGCVGDNTFSKFHLTVDVPPREDFFDLIHANTSFMLAPLTSDCKERKVVKNRTLASRLAVLTFLAKGKFTPWFNSQVCPKIRPGA